MKIFVTGTDTDIGKTFVSLLLCKYLQATYFKPIQTGMEKDADFIQKNAPNIPILPSIYDFQTPVSPHLAAKIENQSIDLQRIVLPEVQNLIVEGAGGILVPLNAKDRMIDLMAFFQIPVLLIAKSGLGTINHTCLSLEVLRQRKIPIMGVIFNRGIDLENKKAVEYYGKVPVIAQIPIFNTNTIYEFPFPNLETFYANASF